MLTQSQSSEALPLQRLPGPRQHHYKVRYSSKMKKLVISIIILIVSVDLISCSNQVTHKSDISSILSDSSVEALQNTNSSMKDSITSRKAELTKIYSKAIAEYIRAVYKNDKTVFDTLFFGKHVYGQAEDFRDIELPGTIENTRIKLVSPQ